MRALAASGAATSTLGLGSVNTAAESTDPLHDKHLPRPDAIVLNNRRESTDINIKFRHEQTGKTATKRATLGSPAFDKSLQELQTKVKFPNWGGSEATFQVIANGEKVVDMPASVGPNGFDSYGTIHVDLRPDEERVGYSVI